MTNAQYQAVTFCLLEVLESLDELDCDLFPGLLASAVGMAWGPSPLRDESLSESAACPRSRLDKTVTVEQSEMRRMRLQRTSPWESSAGQDQGGMHSHADETK